MGVTVISPGSLQGVALPRSMASVQGCSLSKCVVKIRKSEGDERIRQLLFWGKARQVRCRRIRQCGRVRCGDDDSIDEEFDAPPYYSYIDPNSGEPVPARGARTPFPDMAFGGDDMARINRAAQASDPEDIPRKVVSPSTRSRKYTSKRRRSKETPGTAPPSLQIEQEVGVDEEEVGATTETEKRASRNSSGGGDEESDVEADTDNDPAVHNDGNKGRKKDKSQVGASEDVQGLVLTKKDSKIATNSERPLLNEELWWNWRKPPADKEPWSAWHKRTGDSDTVMAAAMAETGQIKLFGDKPTIAEATLARARKHVFYDERMRAEEKRKKEIGPLAYYKEWVKAWPHDTSKEAIQKHFEKTGETEIDQLLNMFSCQTSAEYRHMMGTDIRIRRDPLTMRMRPDQVKQVWGGDPVYPTINYVQDPNCTVDYRGANFHEPTPDIVDMLRQSGRLITQEEIQRQQALEKAQELENGGHDDGMTDAVDIGDKDDEEDDEEDEDEDDDNEDKNDQWKAGIVAKQQLPTSTAKQADASPLLHSLDLTDDVEVEEPDSGPVGQEE